MTQAKDSVRALSPLANADPPRLFPGGYLALGHDFRLGISWQPKHPLDVPPGWCRAWSGEWEINDQEILTRAGALEQVAKENRIAMKLAAKHGLSQWWLAFQVGGVEDSSFVLLENGVAATFHIDSTVSLVVATPEEIERYASAPRGKRGAA